MTTPDLCTDTAWYSKSPRARSQPPRERSSTPVVFDEVPHWLQVLLSYDSDAWLLESNGDGGLSFYAETDAIAATEQNMAATTAKIVRTEDIGQTNTGALLPTG